MDSDLDQLVCVAPSNVNLVWPHVRDRVAEALERGGSGYSAEYVLGCLKLDTMLLWISAGPHYPPSVRSDLEIFGVLVTEVGIVKGGTKKVCTIIAFWAKSFKRCRKFFGRIHRYAREEGCERMKLYGRRGWERALRDDGYTPLFALEKVL